MSLKKLSQKLKSPKAVQAYLKTLIYNREETEETVWSASVANDKKMAHCLEASLLSAAILEHHGYPPLILSLDSKDHLCHAVFVFKTKTGWGAVGKSREIGLHGRAPKFKSIRALVWSYFDPFVDQTGRITGFALLNLDESGTNWRFSEKNLWKLEGFVVNSKHTKLRSSNERFKKVHREYLKRGHTPKKGKHWW